jgi:membrane-bound lytic murein transglycosylase D
MRCKTLIAGLLLSAGTGFAALAADASPPVQLSYTVPIGPVSAAVPVSVPPTAAALATDTVEPAATASDTSGATAKLDDSDRLPEAVEIRAPASLLKPIDLTADYDNLWDRMRTGFSMPNLESENVRRQQVWYINHPDYLRRVVERSRRYMHYIIEELEKRGMPTELALLPIVESAYNPMALSRAKASGLWQFIPSTGRNYKLDQNWWVDERRDIIASTGAALDYLKYVYEMHGDWQLALASYNWGEGAVARAIAKNRAKGLPTDYASLKMPRETQHYVPKLQALKNIINNPNLWAMLEIESIPNKPFFATVPKPADIDVTLAAKFAEMPVADFLALNPAHNRPVIRADIPLVLPADKVDTFISNLEQHDDPLISWETYTFRKGDKLEKLAPRFGLSLAQLKSINGLNGKRARVLPGQGLLVPARTPQGATLQLASFTPPESSSPEPSRKGKRGAARQGKGKAAVASAGNKGGKRVVVTKRTTYIVQKGDTLASIARRFHIETRDIARLNRVKNGIKPGQHLIIAAG